MSWDGEERRQHDNDCYAKLHDLGEDMKKWVREHVCMTMKPTKLRNTMLWSAIVTMLLTSGASIVKGLADAGEVRHNSQEIQEVKDDHKEFVRVYTEHVKEETRVNERILDSLNQIKIDIEVIKEQVE